MAGRYDRKQTRYDPARAGAHACACLIGLADGVVRAVFIAANEAPVESFYRNPIVWASVLTMGIVYGCILFSREIGLRQVYKSVMLVMAVFFMLLPVFTGLTDVESTIALAGYGTFNVLIWVLLADISFNFRFSSITVFGIGWGMITLGVLVIANVDNLCRMILMNRVADTHPLIVIFGVILGIPLFGFWGIIFGPLLISGFLLLMKIYYKEYNLLPQQAQARENAAETRCGQE